MAEMTFYVGMPDAEMHAILEASCGVKDCTITAQALFHAATSTYKTVWLSVREELQMEFGDALTLQNALCAAVKEAAKAGKKTAAPKAPAKAAVDAQGNPIVNGVSNARRKRKLHEIIQSHEQKRTAKEPRTKSACGHC